MARGPFLSLLGCILAAGGALAQPALPMKTGQEPAGTSPYIVQPAPLKAPAVVQLPSPANPLAGVTLPPDRSGDGAYNGGGVVLEQDGRGVNRQVR